MAENPDGMTGNFFPCIGKSGRAGTLRTGGLATNRLI